jgi:metal-responsive CopG/Arc/MetJ family transcriptional regulator
MKTAISIPDLLFRAADRLAKRKGISRSELYVRAVQALVHAEDERELTAQLNRVYDIEPLALEPPLAALPARILEHEDW